METQDLETKEKKKNLLQGIAKALLKIILGVLILAMVLVAALMVALRYPSVQTRVAQKAAETLSETIDHQVTIGSVDIDFFKSVILDEVRVLDRTGNTLFYIGQAEVDIGLYSIFNPKRLHVSSLTLRNLEANLVQRKGSDSLNMSTFITALGNLITQDTVQSKKPFEFSIDELVLKNGHFTYHNYNDAPIKEGLDYQHLDLLNINGRFSEINLWDDSIQTKITNLTTRDRKSGTFLKKLNTRMTFASTYWTWDELDMRLNDSHLAKYLRFDYNTFDNFMYFNDSVTVTAQFDSTYIRSQDIALLADQLKGWDEQILISGKVKGRVANFRARDVDIIYGKNTHITGHISAQGLPDFQNTFTELELGPSSVNARDLREYIPAKIYKVVARAGTIKFNGAFTGFYNDFVANGDFNTALGKLTSDINLKFDKETANHSSYRGYLKTVNFDMGALMGDRSLIKKVSMDGRIKGSGFSFSTARLKMDAKIGAISLNNYTYRNMVVDADLSRETFNGKFRINDPNLVLDASGRINFQNNQQIFDLTTHVKKADLQALGLMDQKLVLQTDAKVDFTGIKLDEIYGEADFSNTKLLYDGKEVNIDSLNIVSHFHDGIRELHVGSEVLALRAGGDFAYSVLFEDLKTLYHEYELNFQNNPVAIANYYRNKPVNPPKEYKIDLDVHLRHINPVLHAFAPSVSVSDFSRVEGTFRNGPTAILSLFGKLDTILVGTNQFYNNNVELTSSKLWNNPEVLANAIFTSERQNVVGAGDTEKLYLEGVWNNRLISFSSNIAQSGTTNQANISGNVMFEQQDIQIVFNQSNINILDKNWTIAPNNTIVIDDGTVDFNNLTFSYGPQSINIFGKLSRDPQESVKVTVKEFQLENLNPILPEQLFGRLNGELVVQDFYQQMNLSAVMAVDSFTLGNQLIGNVVGTTTWDNGKEVMNLDLGISRDNRKVLSLTGTVNPTGADQQLNLLAVMDNAQVKLVEPLLKDILSDMGGTMQGQVKITGKLAGPVLQGSVLVSDGSFVFDYLNTKYSFADRVYFSEKDISFRNVRLRDIYNNTAVIDGAILHDGFNNMVLDLKASFNKLMVLNTTRDDNQPYYGSAFATGEATVMGASSNLQVNITARSEPNTSISIPLDNTTALERKDFIIFENNNVSDSVGTSIGIVTQKKGVDLSGIRLNFNLDVTENAYIELIFDERTGDIIRGRGKGNIRMVIDTRGEFSMFGNYEILQGRYNFTMLGIVNKEFNVRPGGTITWNGDPLQGNLRLTAAYTQRVSLEPILGTLTPEERDSPAARARYPVTAIMDLDGPLTTPEIKLNLEFNDTPNLLEDKLTSYLNSIRNDEQELNRQVFSLLAFKRLSNQNDLQLGLAGDLGSSVGELFSNQLSYWLSQLDSNLEVDIGVSGYGDQIFDDVQLRLSYTFLDGRLRVTREGSLNNNGRYDNGSNTAGDWSLEYYLSKNGQLRLRATYETTPRDFESSSTSSRQKVSILHQANFDHIGELFRRRRLSKRAQRAVERTETPKIEDDTYTLPSQIGTN